MDRLANNGTAVSSAMHQIHCFGAVVLTSQILRSCRQAGLTTVTWKRSRLVGRHDLLPSRERPGKLHFCRTRKCDSIGNDGEEIKLRVEVQECDCYGKPEHAQQNRKAE